MTPNLLSKWLTPGIGIKRWLVLLAFGVAFCAVGLAFALLKLNFPLAEVSWLGVTGLLLGGAALISWALWQLFETLIKPYRARQQGGVIDAVYALSRRGRGAKYVAIGGGTGLPSVLRGLKTHTSNITAVVTVADDGGSSGRLRRDMGVLPPGDLRNNIAALADDESLMTQLFQYRFKTGDLEGHSFGNLFITALAAVSGGSIETALIETAQVLNIQGRVLPATLQDVYLQAVVKLKGTGRTIRIAGESKIGQDDWTIEQIELDPPNVEAYPGSVQAILEADMIVIGPGSLYTSILPNLMVQGIADALRATHAYKVYVCNVATQPGETDDYSVAEHVMAIERHIGRGVFQSVLANNHTPQKNKGVTQYVPPAPQYHEILQRYDVRYTDLVDDERPWRHDPTKLAKAIMSLRHAERSGAVFEKTEQKG